MKPSGRSVYLITFLSYGLGLNSRESLVLIQYKDEYCFWTHVEINSDAIYRYTLWTSFISFLSMNKLENKMQI